MRSILLSLLTFLALSLSPIVASAQSEPDLEPDLLEEAEEATEEEATESEEPAEEGEDEKDAEWSVDDPPGEWSWTPVTIETDEITWSNVDVSPDGTKILFDTLGDVYEVPIAGGEARALTEGISWSYQPRYRPDGEKIVFVSDRGGGDNLWIMNADGSEPEALTSEKEHLVHNPAWSPDGRYVVGRKAFVSARSIPSGEIWMFHVGGGGGLRLVERPHGEESQKNIAEPIFSNDGRYVYYSQDVSPGVVWQYGKNALDGYFVVKRLDLETGETETFVSGMGGAIRPTPSPDGTLLAFVRREPTMRSALYLMDLESGRQWPIYEELERDHQETSGSEGNTPAFAWTPDGKSIVFWAGGKIRRVDVESKESSVIPIRVTSELKVADTVRFPVEVAPERFHTKMIRWAEVTPDGGTVVFQALGHLWTRPLPDGEPRRLTAQDDHFELFPSLSPDGTRVAYVTWDDQELGSVRVVGLDGRGDKVVTSRPGHYVEPRFSADGESVVYRKFRGGHLLTPEWSLEPGIYVAGVTGGEPVRVSDEGFDAHFGGRADRVFFSRRGEGRRLELASVDLRGKDERTHLTGKEVTTYRISPDGSSVAFTDQYDVHVAPFAITGGSISLDAGTSSIPVTRVSSRGGEFLSWGIDGESLYWLQGPILYQQTLRNAFAFLEGAPEELPDPVSEGIDIGFDVEADRPDGTIALVGGRLVTMRDADSGQEVIEDGTIVIRGNRIAAVGPRSEVTVPGGAYVLDVAGKTVIPGLLDAHAHGAMASEEIVPQQNWGQLSNLAFGVTTIHDPSNDTTEIFAAGELQRAGKVVAPRIFSTGTILYGANIPGAKVKLDTYEDAKFHVQRLADAGAISVKSYQQPRRDQRQMIVAAGRELGIMVVPEGGMRFQHNLTEIVDGHTGIEHSLTVADAYEDVLELWSATDVGYTPTFVVAFGGLEGEKYWYAHTNVWENERLLRFVPRSRVEARSIRREIAPDLHYNHIEVAETAHDLRQRGVTVHVGAHGQREGLGAHWELWIMNQGGFTPWEALRAGTIDGASYLGMDHEIGSLEVGKLADLAVIDGNPLEDLRRSEYVDYVMVDGRLYETETMNQIAPDAVEREPLWFAEDNQRALAFQSGD